MANTYQLIASNTLTSSAASVTFSSIPGTYTDLVLRCSIRGDNAVTFYTVRLQVNGLTSTLYSYTALDGNGTTASSSDASGTNQIAEASIPGTSITSNTFSSYEVYIPSYTASQNKQMSSFSVAENNATAADMSVSAYLVRTTNAINEIKIYLSSTNFVSGSTFFLYGIKNS